MFDGGFRITLFDRGQASKNSDAPGFDVENLGPLKPQFHLVILTPEGQVEGLVQRMLSLFDALHLEKRKLFTEDALATFFAEHGTPAEEFRQAFNSFDVDTKTRQAIAATRSYGITGVPAIIINGKYRSSARSTGSYENLLKLVDYLADKENGR